MFLYRYVGAVRSMTQPILEKFPDGESRTEPIFFYSPIIEKFYIWAGIKRILLGKLQVCRSSNKGHTIGYLHVRLG